MNSNVLTQPDHFVAYVDEGRKGKNALWRIVAGIVLIAVVWFTSTILLFVAGVVAIAIRDGDSPADFMSTTGALDLSTLFVDQTGAIVSFLAIASLWPGVWLVLKFLHKRSILGLLGLERRLYWPDFVRSAVVTMAVGVVAVPIALLIDPTFLRGSISLSRWLATAPLMIFVIFLQSSAEEIAFRGYLHQTLAARFATPLIWLALPTGLFTLLHWNGAASMAMNLASLFVILAMSLSMSSLLMATGNLAASMGVHFGNNVVALMLVSSVPDWGPLALFEARPFTDQSWTLAQAVMLGVLGAVVVAVTQALLVHRASPVRLRSLS
jgi:membrane protease YdiL (CAAX protease family)